MNQHSSENILLYPKKDTSSEPVAQDNAHSYSAQMTGKMESFIASMRQLEDALNQEKRKTRKVSDDYAHAHANYERVVRELQTRVRELEIQDRKLRESIDENKNHQEKILHKLREISTEEKKAKSELQHYKAAWADVLTREREAKAFLQEHQICRTRLQELERAHQVVQQSLHEEKSKFEQVDRHSKSYQRELQNALIRIHSSEAKFNELSKEFQTLSQIKRNADDEIAKLENSMKERFKWELATEREKIRAEIEKDAALDRERFRELSRQAMNTEVQKATDVERRRYQADQEKFLLETSALGEALDLAQAENRQLREQSKLASEQSEELIAALRNNLEECEASLSFEKQRYAKLDETLRMEITLLKRQLDVQSEQSEDLALKLRAYQNQIEQLNQQNALFQVTDQHQKERENEILALHAELKREKARSNLLQESLQAEKIQAKEQIEALKREFSEELSEVIEDESQIHFVVAGPADPMSN